MNLYLSLNENSSVQFVVLIDHLLMLCLDRKGKKYIKEQLLILVCVSNWAWTSTMKIKISFTTSEGQYVNKEFFAKVGHVIVAEKFFSRYLIPPINQLEKS